LPASAASARDSALRPALTLPAAIGFFFAFRLFLVPLSAMVLGADPQTGVAASLALNYLLLGVVVFSTFGAAPEQLNSDSQTDPHRSGIASILRLPCVPWVLLFIGFSGCSLAWTIAVSVPAAGAFWCAMAADTAMVVLLLRHHESKALASSLARGYVYGACAIAALAWLMPAESDMRLAAGDLVGPNQIGYVCALGFFFAQYAMRERQELANGALKLCAAVLAITLLRSLSKTTILAFIAGQAVLLLWDKSISRGTKFKVTLAAAVTLTLFSGLLLSYLDVYLNAGNQSETLTGRIGIWAYLFDKALEQPWAGHGFHSVWKVVPVFGPDQFEARHAHNELLQQFYAYGAVGVVMLMGLYGSFWLRVKRLAPSPVKALLLGLLVFALVRGLADTESFDLSLPVWAMVLFTAAMGQRFGSDASGGAARKARTA
jgi:exopolysaccharide production protein ExoQ